MAKLTQATVANILGNPTSAATTINNNAALTIAAVENTLSRDGTTPNEMNADIDLNGNDLLNGGRVDADSVYIRGVEVVSDNFINPTFQGNVTAGAFTGGFFSLKREEENNARYVWQLRPDNSASLVQYDATTGAYIRDAVNVDSAGAVRILSDQVFADNRPVLIQSPDGIDVVRAGKYLSVGQETDFTGGQDKGALILGKGFANDGDSVSLTLDGMANWLAVRSDKVGNPQELIIYNGCMQGYANSVNGTNQLVRTTGVPFTSFAVGDAFYSHGKKFRIASITDANNLTVTKFDGSPHTFTASVSDLYTWCYTTGAGTVNVNGTVVTRVGGAPLPTGVYRDMRFRINGVVRSIASFQGPSQLTLVDNLGTLTNASFDWRGDINDQMSTFRVQAIAGGNEENFNVMVVAGDEFYGRHYSMIAGVAGIGQTRSVGLSAGYYGPYTPKYGVWVHKEEGTHYGFTELGGGAGSGPFRVFMPQTQATGRPFVRIDPVATAGSAIGIQSWSDGASNTPLYLNPQGNSSVLVGSHYLNYLSITPNNTTGNGPTVAAAGGDTNVDLNLSGKGAGGINIGRSFANHLRIDGAAASSTPTLSAIGSDSVIDINIQGKSTGGVTLSRNLANYVRVDGAATTGTPIISAVGSDAAIDLTLAGKAGGQVRVAGSGGLKITTAAGTDRMVRYATADVNRFIVGVNSTAEGGSNAGSDFLVGRYSDAGALLGFPLGINRATGRISMGDLATSTSYTSDSAAATGGVLVGQLYRNGNVVQIRVV